jgi:hypothetical protein
LTIQLTSAGPATATGTAERNVDGQAIAITVFSSVKWWGRLWLPAFFWYARHFPRKTLAELSFIHFARWSIVTRLPGSKLRHPQLFFESNFNGGWEEYIDAFSHVLTQGMTFFWGSSRGYPKPLPVAPFKAYIKSHEIEASHFWSAYPDSTSTMVQGALKADAALEELLKTTQGASPDEFAAAWRAFLTEVQRYL